MPVIDLEPYRAEIERWYIQENLSQTEITIRLQDIFGRHTSVRTLQRRLADWGFIKYEYELSTAEAEIRRYWNAGFKIWQIKTLIETEREDLRPSLRSLERLLSSWGDNRHAQAYDDNLVPVVRFWFWEKNFSDKEISAVLRTMDVNISPAALTRLRFDHNMKRRIRDENDKQTLRDAVERWLDEREKITSEMLDMGRGTFHLYIRQNTMLGLSRDELREIYLRRWPDAVAQRRDIRQFRQAKFSVPGVNFMWSFDGYLKLRKFGFEIYACIDAYSRYIIFCNVSRSISMPSVTLWSYLQAVDCLGFRPWFTRSDHGSETPLWASAQHHLASITKPTMTFQDPNIEEPVTYSQGHRLTDSHLWGGSRGNRKIEQWWRHVRGKVSDRWIAYADELIAAGLFDRHELADQVAVYAIYGPMIRQEIHQFIRTWNAHKIRFQPNKDHVVHGNITRLWLNLERDDVVDNWAVYIDSDPQVRNALTRMREPLFQFDFESLLAPSTQRICQDWLDRNPLTTIQTDPGRPHLQSYLALRRYLTAYIEEGQQPALAYNVFPRGGLEWYRQILRDQYNNIADMMPDGQPLGQYAPGQYDDFLFAEFQHDGHERGQGEGFIGDYD